MEVNKMIKSRCGCLCDSLKCKEVYKIDCEGCINIKQPFWGECPVKTCCENKKLNHCGECEDFPCELLNSFAYDKEHGDNGARIEQCKEWVKLYPK